MRKPPRPDAAAHLAAQAVEQDYSGLTPATVEATLDVLFDSLAVALGGVDAPGIRATRDALAVWGRGRSTVWGTDMTAAAPFAALANAGALHALDYDDTDDQVPLHAASVVLPVLLADLQENRPDCRGHEFLTALAVGLDGAMRIGRAGGPRGRAGWNYSVISGGIGASLGLARLRRWDAEQTVALLGHQLAQTAGSLQSIIDGSLAKRFQPAMVAKDVLFGAALTGAGVDGPTHVLEGRAGFFALYQDGSYDRNLLVEDAEGAPLVTDLSLKPYPACRFTHAAIDLALRMRDEGVTPESIRHLTFETSGQAYNMVGREFDPATATIVDAQFSIAYTASVALHRGAVLIGDFTQSAVRDRSVGAFAAEHITIKPDESVDFLAMAPVIARVRFTDGSEAQFSTETVSGSPQQRMSAERLRTKAVDCLAHGRAVVSDDELWETVRSLADDAPLTRLLALLSRADDQGGTR